MTTGLALRPFHPIRRRHMALARQVATVNHGILDQSTSLGYLWSFLHPVAMLVILYALFNRRVGQGIPHYGVYLLIGLVHFTHFSKSTAAAMRILYEMRTIVNSVIFPKDVLVYSSLMTNAPEFLISLAATVLIAGATGVPLGWSLLLLPLVVVAQLLLVLWMSLLLSVAYVFLRDLDHIYEVAMRLFFFVTPIIYSIDDLSPATKRIALLNPLAHVMAYARDIILENRIPPLGSMLGLLGANLVLVFVAVAIFRRAEPALVEQL